MKLLLSLSLCFALLTTMANPYLGVASAGIAVVSGGITHADRNSTAFGGATQSPVVNMPTNILADDILITVFSTDSVHDTGGTPPTDWVKFTGGEQDAGTDTSGSIFWKRANGTEGGTALTWTTIFNASEVGIAVVLVYRGCKTSGDPFEGFVGETSTAGLSKTLTTTTTVPNTMVVGIYTIDPATTTNDFEWADATERFDFDTTPTGLAGSQQGQINVGDKLFAGTGSVSMDGTYDSSDEAAEFILALIPQ